MHGSDWHTMSTFATLENYSAMDFGNEILAAAGFLLFSAPVLLLRQFAKVQWHTHYEGSECRHNKNKIMISIAYVN
jgi:hypothetical protein